MLRNKSGNGYSCCAGAQAGAILYDLCMCFFNYRLKEAPGARTDVQSLRASPFVLQKII